VRTWAEDWVKGRGGVRRRTKEKPEMQRSLGPKRPQEGSVIDLNLSIKRLEHNEGSVRHGARKRDPRPVNHLIFAPKRGKGTGKEKGNFGWREEPKRFTS